MDLINYRATIILILFVDCGYNGHNLFRRHIFQQCDGLFLFYEESTVRDYPVTGHKMTFLVMRRRWLEVVTSKGVSKRWDIVAEGTRFSKEFAAFFKIFLDGYPVSGCSLE